MQNNFTELLGVSADRHRPNGSWSLASLPPCLEKPTKFLKTGGETDWALILDNCLVCLFNNYKKFGWIVS